MPRIQESQAERVNLCSDEQLRHFDKELQQAGDFDQLMIQKQAIRYAQDQLVIIQYRNPNAYQEKYLISVYANAPFHTDIPYQFWNKMLVEWRAWKNRCQSKMHNI